MPPADLKKEVGPYYVGEVPESLTLTVTENDGTALDLTGATVDASWNVDDGTDGALTVSVLSAAGGTISVDWDAAQFTAAGILRATVWAEWGSGTKIVVARLVGVVSDPGPDLD